MIHIFLSLYLMPKKNKTGFCTREAGRTQKLKFAKADVLSAIIMSVYMPQSLALRKDHAGDGILFRFLPTSIFVRLHGKKHSKHECLHQLQYQRKHLPEIFELKSNIITLLPHVLCRLQKSYHGEKNV